MSTCRTCYDDGRKDCPRCNGLGIEFNSFETQQIVNILLGKIRELEQRIDILEKNRITKDYI